MVEEEFPCICIVVQRVGARELRPRGDPSQQPGSADVVGLLGFDGPWCELGLTFGDMGPDEGGCFLSRGNLTWTTTVGSTVKHRVSEERAWAVAVGPPPPHRLAPGWSGFVCAEGVLEGLNP